MSVLTKAAAKLLKPDAGGVLRIPEGTVEVYGFGYRLDIKLVIFPASLKKIRSGTFCGCSNYGNDCELVLPPGVTEIGSYAFGNCTGLTGEVLVTDAVKLEYDSDGDGPFYGTNIRGIKRIPAAEHDAVWHMVRGCGLNVADASAKIVYAMQGIGLRLSQDRQTGLVMERDGVVLTGQEWYWIIRSRMPLLYEQACGAIVHGIKTLELDAAEVLARLQRNFPQPLLLTDLGGDTVELKGWVEPGIEDLAALAAAQHPELVERDANWEPPSFICSPFGSRVEYEAWVADGATPTAAMPAFTVVVGGEPVAGGAAGARVAQAALLVGESTPPTAILLRGWAPQTAAVIRDSN